MFAKKEFVELSRNFVCVRLETYESKAHQDMVRELLGGKMVNTAFVLLAPDGKTQLTRAGRSPSKSFTDKRWKKQGGDLDVVLEAIKEAARDYPGRGNEQEALLPDFSSFGQALNVSSAEQRLLLLTVAPQGQRDQLRDSMRKVANDPEVRGCFHYDTAQNSDSQWANKIENVSAKTGHFLIHPGQFGLKGTVVAHFPLNASPALLKETMLKAKKVHQSQEKPKHYRDHIAQAREQRIAFTNNIRVGVDKNADGEVDRQRGVRTRRDRRESRSE